MTSTVRSQKKVLELLAELAGGSYTPEDDIVHEGTRIVLPSTLSVKDAITLLTQRLASDEEQVVISRAFDANPWDGAICAWDALREAFGTVGIKGTQGFFGEDPPHMMDIATGPGEQDRMQVPFGTISVPGLAKTSITFDSKDDDRFGAVFAMHVRGPRKYRAQIEGLFRVVATRIKERSIYRGKAIDGGTPPNFLDLSKLDVRNPMYAAETQLQLEANIWGVLKHRDALIEAGITRKRAVLLYGSYGTGKTLAGYLTARHAVDAGWTFLYVRPGQDDIEQVLKVARMYEPACVFVEDLDGVRTDGTSSASRLLDLFDGVTAKGADVLVVLTTNHPEDLHPGMLRPGRLDAVIEVGALDAKATENLIRNALPEGKLATDVDWDRVFGASHDLMPAYIKEAADRAFRYALGASDGNLDGVRIDTDALVGAMTGIKPQLALMRSVENTEDTPTLDGLIRKAVADGSLDHMVRDFDDPPYIEGRLTKEALERATNGG